MKSFKKMLKSELNKVVPPLDEKIKAMPIPAEQSEIRANGSNTLTRSKKTTLISVIAIALILLIVGLSLGLTLPFKSDEAFIFTVEINPSATIMTDKNGIVTDIVSSNSDADIILSNSSVKAQIIGKTLSEAIVAYTDCAGKLGFIDPNKQGSAVRISACERGSDLLLNAQNKLQSYFIDKGIFAVVIGETVDLSEFSSRSGFGATSIEKLGEALKDSSVLFGDRAAQSADDNMLKALYNQLVLSSEILPIVKEYLLECMPLLEQFEAISHIIPIEQIKEILDDFSTELLAQYSNMFADILQLIGKSGDIVNILKAPKNAKDFLDKLTYVLDVKFTNRKQTFEDKYNEIKSITEESYNNFVENIIESYGSLGDYWNAIK